MTLIRRISLLLCLFTGFAAAGFSQSSRISYDAFQQEMLRQVNQLRAEGCRCGRRYMPPAPPLNWDRNLSQAATRQALDLKRMGRLSHTGSDGSKVGQRVSDSGYEWQAVGENIAWNYQSVRAVVIGWKNSPGHCENMMSQSYSQMGAAQAGAYMVQVFGRPRSR